ncbi:unnamed protein product [Nippostrongylus brasiliensis]|uniref:Uncharacterized protein n=1 Tax=Nippostrongylus brasiliensis TaxID=27835 RepID=A0A0N4YDF9_NIPBR|nr:unnamed protein product [Nippostrongylus brasiliensis]
MTFTDHWSKRSDQRAPFQRYKPATGESEKQQQREQQQQQHFCEAEKVSSALSQLSRLQEMQGSLTDYLSSCYQSRV